MSPKGTEEVGSIPTAPTKSSDDSIDLRSRTPGLGNGVGILWWHGVLFSVLPLVRSQYSNYGSGTIAGLRWDAARFFYLGRVSGRSLC